MIDVKNINETNVHGLKLNVLYTRDPIEVEVDGIYLFINWAIESVDYLDLT